MNHITKNGQKIKIEHLDTNHLRNIIKWIEKKAQNGLTVITGTYGNTADDMSADEETYYGEKVKRILNYNIYRAELNKRISKLKS